MEPKPCPFCKCKKLKVDSKKSSSIRFIDGKKEECHIVTVRCNKCHTRGPTVSIWLPVGKWYKSVEMAQEQAFTAWNRRGD